jgi:hypothetical protein
LNNKSDACRRADSNRNVAGQYLTGTKRKIARSDLITGKRASTELPQSLKRKQVLKPQSGLSSRLADVDDMARLPRERGQTACRSHDLPAALAVRAVDFDHSALKCGRGLRM